MFLCVVTSQRLRARPSPLTENDSENAEAAAAAVDDVPDLEVERSIDVIPEDIGGSPKTESSLVSASGESRNVRLLLKDTATHHATSV